MTDKKGGVRYNDYHMESFLIHGLQNDAFWEYGHHVIPPITASTTFRLDSVERGHQGFVEFSEPKFQAKPGEKPIYIYDRVAEPTVALLEHSMMQAEQGETATAFASGMAAINAAIGVLASSGDGVISHRMVYGCTYSLFQNWLPKSGISVDLIDMTDLELLAATIKDNTRVIYFETPANPTLELLDVSAISELVARVNEERSTEEKIRVVVDNTFATSYCQRPLMLGADIVVHSLTKNIMGFGTDMGGILVARELELHPDIRLYRKDYGGVLSPRAAWSILVYGLPSLGLRVRKQVENCMKVSAFLESRKEIRAVYYPGLPSHPQHELAKQQMTDFNGEFMPGIMIYFEVDGEGESVMTNTKRLIDSVADNSYSITLAVSLGQLKTLIEAPGLMTHSSYSENAARSVGIGAGGVRLSIGVEDADDIIKDLAVALDSL